MLKVEMDARGGRPEALMAEGETKIIAAEIGEMIRQIYNLLLAQNEDTALTVLIAGTDSPVWRRTEVKGTGTVIVMPAPKKGEK